MIHAFFAAAMPTAASMELLGDYHPIGVLLASLGAGFLAMISRSLILARRSRNHP